MQTASHADAADQTRRTSRMAPAAGSDAAVTPALAHLIAPPQRAGAAPVLRPADLLALQRTVGNRAVQRLLRARAQPPTDTPLVAATAGPIVQRSISYVGYMGKGQDSWVTWTGAWKDGAKQLWQAIQERYNKIPSVSARLSDLRQQFPTDERIASAIATLASYTSTDHVIPLSQGEPFKTRLSTDLETADQVIVTVQKEHEDRLAKEQHERQLEAEAAKQRQLEEEAKKRQLEAEAAKKRQLEAEAAKQRQLEEEAAKQRQLEEEAAKKRQQEEERRLRQLQKAEENRKRREETKRQQQEEAQRKRDELLKLQAEQRKQAAEKFRLEEEARREREKQRQAEEARRQEEERQRQAAVKQKQKATRSLLQNEAKQVGPWLKAEARDDVMGDLIRAMRAAGQSAVNTITGLDDVADQKVVTDFAALVPLANELSTRLAILPAPTAPVMANRSCQELYQDLRKQIAMGGITKATVDKVSDIAKYLARIDEYYTAIDDEFKPEADTIAADDKYPPQWKKQAKEAFDHLNSGRHELDRGQLGQAIAAFRRDHIDKYYAYTNKKSTLAANRAAYLLTPEGQFIQNPSAAALEQLVTSGQVSQGEIKNAYRAIAWDDPALGEFSIEVRIEGMPNVVVHAHCSSDGTAKEGNAAHVKLATEKYNGRTYQLTQVLRDELLPRPEQALHAWEVSPNNPDRD